MEYDKTKYTKSSWLNPLKLNWILNPAIVINELILGQRIPKTILIEKDRSKRLFEKQTFVPCPHCGKLHSGLKWSAWNNETKNWFGLYCDNCGKTIPCLMNITTFLLHVVTFPFWIGFIKIWKKKCLKKQPERFKNIDYKPVNNMYEGIGWVSIGLLWSFSMYLSNIALSGLTDSLPLRKVLIGIPIWIIGGLLFGYVTKRLSYKEQIKREKYNNK